MSHYFRVTQVRSEIGATVPVRSTLKGLGLKKRGRISHLQDTQAIRGMLTKVHHLVKVERVEGEIPPRH